MNVITSAMEMVHERDPAEIIMADIAHRLPGIHIVGADILWIAYQRDGKTRAGVWLPESMRKEDGIQGQVGLIVKVGPEVATREDIKERFGGNPPEVGQWAMVDTRYGIQFIIGGSPGIPGRHARITEFKQIYALLDKPDGVI